MALHSQFLRNLSVFGILGTIGLAAYALPIGQSSITADVVVYGATPAGIMAAIEAGRQGKSVILLEPTQHVGGMMSNGLGYTDLYADKEIGGLPKAFFSQVSSVYGKDPLSNKGRSFEPHVAEATFLNMINQESHITLKLGVSIETVERSGANIQSIDAKETVEASDGVNYRAKVFIDASYTGDLMAYAGVPFTIGRESSAQYGEDVAGVGQPARMGNQSISPYVVPGDPKSGLIDHVTSASPGLPGSADSTLMGYNYRVCLTTDANNQIPIVVPKNYAPEEYELLGRIGLAENPALTEKYYLDVSSLPNQKFDWNNTRNFFSSDEVGYNYNYPTAGPAGRQKIEEEEKRYMQGYFYFLTTDPRIPASVQNWVRGFGLCKDEFIDNGGWPHQIYVRKARRMLGAYVLTENDLKLQSNIPDSIGVGGYTSDDHLHHILAVNNEVEFEASRGFRPNPYPIPYRILTPQAVSITNLLVPVDVSASHIAFDSLRIETTLMIMGQAAGAAAALTVDGDGRVQHVNTLALQSLLASEGAVITPQ